MPSLKDQKGKARSGEAQQKIWAWFPIAYVVVSFVFLVVMVVWQAIAYSNHTHATTILPHGELEVLTAAVALQFIAFVAFAYKAK